MLPRVTFLLPVVLIACSDCEEGAAPADASADASVDNVAQKDGGADASVDVNLPDAPPGWRTLTEIPGCSAQVPLDAQAAMPPIQWVPCPSKNPACAQIDTSDSAVWSQDGTSGTIPRFAYLRTSPKHDYVIIVHFGTVPDIGQTIEYGIYATPSYTPVQAFRIIDFGVSCSPDPVFGPTKGAILQGLPVVDRIASGTMPGVFTSLAFAALSPAMPNTDTPSSFAMSDTTFAVALQPANRIARLVVGQATYAITKGIKVNEPVVVGDDVFGFSEYGTDGWSTILRVNLDGSTTLFRAVAQRHISAFRAGAGWMAWLETYGDPNWQNFDQPKTELWAAPYTNDPSTLATTAKKLADLPGVRTGSPEPRYADGFYAARGGTLPTDNPIVYVVRVSDGVVKKLDMNAIVGPDASKPYFLDLAGVSETEVIGVLHHVNGAPYFGVARIQLGVWP